MKRLQHKFAEVIKAWADGAEIQTRVNGSDWFDTDIPSWSFTSEYRVKPEPKPDVVVAIAVVHDADWKVRTELGKPPNIEFTFDGETAKLKAVRVIE